MTQTPIMTAPMTTTPTVTPITIGTTDDPSVNEINYLLVQYDLHFLKFIMKSLGLESCDFRN